MEKIGLIIGRFNPLHVGHEYLINYALSKCDKLLIFIGSANKNLSLSNPFSYEEREMMLKSVFDNRIIVAPLNDIGVGNVPAWGNYIISSALNYVSNVDFFFYGDEAKCNLWFDEKAKKNNKKFYSRRIEKVVKLLITMRRLIIRETSCKAVSYNSESLKF